MRDGAHPDPIAQISQPGPEVSGRASLKVQCAAHAARMSARSAANFDVEHVLISQKINQIFLELRQGRRRTPFPAGGPRRRRGVGTTSVLAGWILTRIRQMRSRVLGIPGYPLRSHSTSPLATTLRGLDHPQAFSLRFQRDMSRQTGKS